MRWTSKVWICRLLLRRLPCLGKEFKENHYAFVASLDASLQGLLVSDPEELQMSGLGWITKGGSLKRPNLQAQLYHSVCSSHITRKER